jgi:hypothetical protein
VHKLIYYYIRRCNVYALKRVYERKNAQLKCRKKILFLLSFYRDRSKILKEGNMKRCTVWSKNPRWKFSTSIYTRSLCHSFVRLFVKFVSDIFCIENCVWEKYEKEAEISTNTTTLLFLCNMYIQQLRLPHPSIHPSENVYRKCTTNFTKKGNSNHSKKFFIPTSSSLFYFVSVPVVRS